MELTDRIFVAGHTGLVGSSIYRRLRNDGYKNILTFNSRDFDLRQKESTDYIFSNYKFDYVFLAAAKVGGILANSTRKAEFIYDNLLIQTNVIHGAYESGVKKLCFLGSSCIYPRLAQQPIKEEYFMTGALEGTNDAYAIAKIAGIKMCQAYMDQYGWNAMSLMPTNLFGPNDNFDLNESHVLPALLRKFHEAKINNEPTVEVWGTGEAKREFLHVDDLADAAIHLMDNYNSTQVINIGTGKDVSIRDLAYTIANVVGYQGDIIWDRTKPDGTPRKLLDVRKAKDYGWESKISLEDGLKQTYEWYIKRDM